MSAATSHGAPDRLVSMANQISEFFTPYPTDQAVAGIADHIAKFWDRKMRMTIIDHLDRGGAGLRPDVAAALRIVKGDAVAQ